MTPRISSYILGSFRTTCLNWGLGQLSTTMVNMDNECRGNLYQNHGIYTMTPRAIVSESLTVLTDGSSIPDSDEENITRLGATCQTMTGATYQTMAGATCRTNTGATCPTMTVATCHSMTGAICRTMTGATLPESCDYGDRQHYQNQWNCLLFSFFWH